jgi:hypothetical protein
MIKLVFVFLILVLLIAYAYHIVSKFTLHEYKLLFKIGAFATAALLVLFFISMF